MAGWESNEQIIRMEIIQRQEEGCDTQGFKERVDDAKGDPVELETIYQELMALEIRPDYPYVEPQTYDAIVEASQADQLHVPQGEASLSQFEGAWMGRCIGCALGKPLERAPFFFGEVDHPGWMCVHEWFKGADAYPIRNYTPMHSTATTLFHCDVDMTSSNSVRENIQYMETDDDIRYTVLGLILLKEKGIDWTSLDVGHLWHHRLPYFDVCTAETQAYLNAANSEDFRHGKYTEAMARWIREYKNPYREWIGAQIRVDAYAYGAAGNPVLAADLAYRDAAFSHVKNGVYGAMYVAAMISMAFVQNDVDQLVGEAVKVIPVQSRLHADIQQAIQITRDAIRDDLQPEQLAEQIYEAFKHYHPIHTNNNAAVCTAAILWSRGDFDRAVEMAVLCGWDTDCNGATVGSVMGAMLGIDGIPDRWKDPLNDTLHSSIVGYDPKPISDCAKETYAVYQQLRS